MNLVYGKARYESFVAQWLEHLTVYGRSWVQFLLGTQVFLFVRWRQVGYIIFLISSLSLKLTIFLYLPWIKSQHKPATEQRTTIPFCLCNQDVASSESQEMGLCIPREYQTLSSFETNVLLAYQLHPLLQASTTNAFLCVCSQNFLTTRPHSVRNNMFIVHNVP